MLLKRNFTRMLIPVNYAAWGLPVCKPSCGCTKLLPAAPVSHAHIAKIFDWSLDVEFCIP
jgi:hypothetical protein